MVGVSFTCMIVKYCCLCFIRKIFNSLALAAFFPCNRFLSSLSVWHKLSQIYYENQWWVPVCDDAITVVLSLHYAPSLCSNLEQNQQIRLSLLTSICLFWYLQNDLKSSNGLSCSQDRVVFYPFCKLKELSFLAVWPLLFCHPCPQDSSS